MFPTTRMSIFERYHKGGDERRQAVSDWYVRYRAPMTRFVVRHFPSLAKDADDVVQSFVLQKVLPEQWERSLLAVYESRKGTKFRSFLGTALKNFCVALVRPKKTKLVKFTLDEDYDAPRVQEADAFEVFWARQVVGRAFRLMRAECSRDPRLRAAWGVLEARFLRPFRGKKEIEYEELVQRLGFSSPGKAQQAATDSKRMLKDTLISVVTDYIGSRDARSELMDLWRAIRRIREKQGGTDSGASPH